MNELENMIAGLPQPEPGKGLDERIGRLLAAGAGPQTAGRWRGLVAWPAVAASCALLGFYIGRASVSAPPTADAVAARRAEHDRGRNSVVAERRIVNLPLEDEQFASLFLRGERGEGPLGHGPLTVKTFTSP